MRRRGEIPEPIRVSRGAVGWRQTTIREWLDRREAEATDDHGRKGDGGRP
jgi:predicted DNA-binding transcriptional regulator AlpA